MQLVPMYKLLHMSSVSHSNTNRRYNSIFLFILTEGTSLILMQELTPGFRSCSIRLCSAMEEVPKATPAVELP